MNIQELNVLGTGINKNGCPKEPLTRPTRWRKLNSCGSPGEIQAVSTVQGLYSSQ